MKYLIIFFISAISILMTGCSAKITPIKASYNTITVKIENGGNEDYALISRDQGEVDKKQPSAAGLIDFDIPQAVINIAAIDDCFYVRNAKDIILIDGNIYAFRNPALKSFLNIHTHIKPIEVSIATTNTTITTKSFNLTEIESRLTDNTAYRSEQCITPAVSDIPMKPTEACANPDEENILISKKCTHNKAENQIAKTFGDKIGGVIGSAVCWMGGPLTRIGCGIIGSVIGEAVASDVADDCPSKTLNACRDTYRIWKNDMEKIKEIPERMQMRCLEDFEKLKEIRQEITTLKSKLDNDKTQLSIAKQKLFDATKLKTPLTAVDYCQ